MKEFLSNYGFWIYLVLTVLNYVFMYFRTKKMKFSSVFNSISSATERILKVLKEQGEIHDSDKIDDYIKTELFDGLSREQIGRVIDYLCEKLQNQKKEGDD